MQKRRGDKKQDAYEDLDKAKKQYEEIHEKLTAQYHDHNLARDTAYHEVDQAEILLDSIRHKPVFGEISNLKKIKSGKRTFIEKEEIERAEKTKLLETNAASIAVAGVAAATVFSFRDYITDLFDIDSKKKLSWLNPKTLVVILIVAVLFVVFWIGYIITQKIKRNSIRTIIEETKKIRAQTQEEKDEDKRLNELSLKLKGQTELLRNRLAILGQYHNAEFKKIPREHQKLLMDYKIDAETLIAYLTK